VVLKKNFAALAGTLGFITVLSYARRLREAWEAVPPWIFIHDMRMCFQQTLALWKHPNSHQPS